MASAPTCTCTGPFSAFCYIGGSSWPATSEAAVFGSVLRERLRAPHVSRRLTSHRDKRTLSPTSSSRQQLVTKPHTPGWKVTAARFHGATSHSARTGCSLSHDRDEPITAECVDRRGRRLPLTSPRRRRSSKNSFELFMNTKLNSASYTQ